MGTSPRNSRALAIRSSGRTRGLVEGIFNLQQYKALLEVYETSPFGGLPVPERLLGLF